MHVGRFLEWAHHGLQESDEAQAYLRGRGISSEQWDRHCLGFISSDYDVDSSEDPGHGEVCYDRDLKSKWCDSCHYRSWSSIWEPQDEGPKMQRVGRRFHGCVVFPLTTYSGTTIGFQVRSIEQKQYDSYFLARRPEAAFFGTSQALESIWSTGEVWLVEGPGDQLIVERLVAPNCLALTTSAVNKQQAKFLRRFVKKVCLCLDLDHAGRDGVKSFMKHLGSQFEVRYIQYPKLRVGDKDVGDYWKRVGDQRFQSYFSKNVLSVL